MTDVLYGLLLYTVGFIAGWAMRAYWSERRR